MSGKIIIIFIILFILSGCNKKDELEIDQKSIKKPTENSAADTAAVSKGKSTEELIHAEIEEGKPLVVVSESDTIHILVRSDGAPGMFLGEDGEVHGFYVELEKLIMDKMGHIYSFTPYSDVGPAVHMLKSGTHHIALSVPDLPDYRSFLNLSIHYEVLNYVVFVRNDNSDIVGVTKEEILEKLHGKKVGVQTQGHIYQILKDIKEIEIVEYPTTTKALNDLNEGILDAVPDVKRIGMYYSEQNNWNIKPVGEAIISRNISTGFSKVYDTSFIERYNRALESLISDGSLETLWESYFGPMEDEDKP